VLDGAMLAAQAIGARDCVVAAPARVHGPVRAALRERRHVATPAVRIKLEASGSGYVAGEETALLSHLEGRAALPRLKPPFPAERGLNGRPTLVQNAETLAHVALIARHGAAWFRDGGAGGVPGTTLVSVSGAVQAPGVYEIPAGTPLPDLLRVAGGPLQQVRALLVGGYFGGWVEGTGDGLSFADASLQSAGVSAGAGVVVALGAADCPVAETAALAAWLAEESAGQCGPCVYGLAALAELLGRIARGRTESGDAARLARWTEMVRGRGACRHPDGVARMISTAARVFATELAEHARRGPCAGCHRARLLLTPRTREAASA
jgi:NADH:ubiquinone oxidoreductase subunit F (NADH-binding)